MTISSSESLAINVLRLMSTISIIICHVLQYYKSSWCQIFNIGVQVFWAMSGYLYGKRTIVSWREFYRKRWVKIYLPFIIWVLGVFVVFYCNGIKITFSHLVTYMLSLQGETHYFARYGLKGLGHLWFLTGLWACYISLPFLQKVRSKEYILIFVILFVSIILYGSVLFFSSYYLWIFAFAYFYGSIGEGKTKKILQWSIFTIAILFLCTTTWENLQNQYFWRLHHIFIGLACVVIFVVISALLKINFGENFLINVSRVSNFSYYLYLTHMVWIFGPLSILSYVGSEFLGILSVIAATLFSSYVLYILTKKTSLVLFHKTIKSKKQ